jgi:hypothetical protein
VVVGATVPVGVGLGVRAPCVLARSGAGAALLPDALSGAAAGDPAGLGSQPLIIATRTATTMVQHTRSARWTSLAATHRLRAADAVHLATAVVAGADRFITNNRRDFPESLTDIDVTYPGTLPDPSVNRGTDRRVVRSQDREPEVSE